MSPAKRTAKSSKESRFQRAGAVAVVAAILALSTPSHAQSGEVKKYLNSAVTLYENLEYEKALKQIQRAKGKSAGATDDGWIALYEGIVLADMGKEDKALTAFKTGLSMDPDAKLPLEVGPKVTAVFNKARDNVRKLLGPQLEKQREEERLRVEAEKARAAEEQRKKDEEAARREAALRPPTPPPDQPPLVAAAAPSSGSSLRPLALIPLGVGLASAGVATYFLLGAKSRQDALNNGTAAPGEAIAVRDAGKSMATMGYVFTAVAGAGLASAAVMFGLGGESSAPVTLLAAPGQVYVGINGAVP